MGIVTITGDTDKDIGSYDVEVKKDTVVLLRKKLKLDDELNFLTGLPALVRSLNTTLGSLEFDILVKAAEIDTAILLEEDTKELTEQLIELTTERNFIQSRREEINLIIRAKQQTLIIYNARLNETDFRTLWVTDLKTDLAVGDTVVSVELEQNKDRILIAPHIYKVKQSDMDHKSIIKGNAQTKLNDLNTAVSNANARMDSNQLHIDALFVDLEAAKGNPIEFNRVKNEIELTVASKAKFLTERQSQQESADKANNELLEIESEFNALAAAFQSPDGLFVPGINEFTKQLQPILSSNRMSAAYNVIALPAVQKWEPTYRSGIISNINTGDNVCTVSLDVTGSKPPTLSTKRTLDINQQSVYTLVPVRYGSCDAAAFEDGDEVMVHFRDRDYTDPEVIGFINNPKPCEKLVVYFRHYTGAIYEYDSEGNSPRFVATVPFQTTGMALAGKHLAEDYYFVDFSTGKLEKNGVIVTGDLRPTGVGSMEEVFSDGKFLWAIGGYTDGSGRHVLKRDLDGGAILDYKLSNPNDIYYISRGTSNKFISGRPHGIFGSIQDVSLFDNDTGSIDATFSLNNFFNFINVVCASNELLCWSTDETFASSLFTIHVHIEDATQVGTLGIPFADIDSFAGDFTKERPAAIAITDTHFFLLTQSQTIAHCLIYEIDVTRTVGVITSVVLGNKIHSVNSAVSFDFVQNRQFYRSHVSLMG